MHIHYSFTICHESYYIIFPRYLEPDLEGLLCEEMENNFKTEKFKSLNRSIAKLVIFHAEIYSKI